MAQLAKFLSSTAGVASGGGAGLDVDDVFSTTLYEGTNAAHTITNNIDLTEGGMLWFKNRDLAEDPMIVDTVRGGSKDLYPNETNAEDTDGSIASFNNNGFTFISGANKRQNVSGYSYVNWTFRKAPKFFDIVTYTGNGSARTISHNLGSVPGMIMVKLTSGSDAWHVYHRGLNGGSSPEDYYLQLNSTDAQIDNATIWNDTAPTDSVFTVGTNGGVNGNGSTYVAYLFAHHANDGSATGFGPDGDSPVISCGSYTGNGSTTGVFQDLGFEPQWIIFKETTITEPWVMLDNMRGVSGLGSNDPRLQANSSVAEAGGEIMQFNATGFTPLTADDKVNGSSRSYIYMAIRRGPLAAPTDATKVFAMDTLGGTSPTPPGFNSGFPVDMAFLKPITSSSDWLLASRLIQGKQLVTNSNAAEVDESANVFDYQNGYYNFSSSASNYQAWMWKRAPSYFDVVCYDGSNSNRTFNHSLGVAPEMIWVKKRSSTRRWRVFIPALSGILKLNETGAMTTNDAKYYFGDNNNIISPTATQFTVTEGNGDVNYSGDTYIAYLFATVAGVSKVGSFTLGSSGSSNIDCGFSSGARFILAKKTSGTGGWLVWDTTRGIVAGADKFLYLNNTDAETDAGGYDFVDPYSQGFTIPEAAYWGAGSYIFYAIA